MRGDRENVTVAENNRAPTSARTVPPETTEAAKHPEGGRRHGVFRAPGLGLITGAADDDCSAIGTYAAAGAKIGPTILWTAPVTFPMMFAVVYLSAKVGQVSGRGLFHAIRDYFPRWVLYPTLVLFALGMIAVGFLAVRVMTTGGAYDLAQTMGWKYGLHARPRDASDDGESAGASAASAAPPERAFQRLQDLRRTGSAGRSTRSLEPLGGL